MAFAQDPNALSILLRNQPQIPQQTEQDAQLASMIPDEQLFQAQEAIGRHGAESGGAYSIPSREALKQSGMAELRKIFGMQQAEAQAKAYPNQVTGEYGLANRRLQNKGALDVAQATEQAKADDRAQQQAFQQAQQQRGQVFAGGQGDLNRAAVERNTEANIAGRMGVAQEGTRRTAATQASIDARKKTPGVLDWVLKHTFGGPDEAATPKYTGQIAPEISATAAQMKQHPEAAHLTARQLLDQGKLGPDVTPDEFDQFQSVWGR